MSLNLGTILQESAKKRPDKVAVIQDARSVTYRELEEKVKRFANVLRSLGLEPGDKVATMVPNILEFPITYYGILYAGCEVVPLNILLKDLEVEYHLEDSGAAAFVVAESYLEPAFKGFSRVDTCRDILCIEDQGGKLIGDQAKPFGKLLEEASPEFDMHQSMPDDGAVIIYTSGTTGRPKGAELGHFNLFFNCHYCAEELMEYREDDVCIAVLPLYHSFGQTCSMNTTIHSGGTLTVVPRFDPELVLETIDRDKVSIFQGVPTMFLYLLSFPEAEKYDTSSLRLCMSGGAAMPVEVLKGFESKFGAKILEGYGLSETSPVATFNTPKLGRKVGSIGIPLWGADVKIFDENDTEVPVGEVGEVVIRGHNVMKGYYNRPEANKEVMRSGWFHTGDLGKMDEDGFFYIVDRKKDMIIRGGYNVYPREIEEVLYGYPGVLEVAVIGVQDEVMGEDVKACVVMEEGAEATAEQIISYCKERVAAYKYPRIVEFFDEPLPKGPTGKILKREMRTT